jgi:nitrate reductase gamma subunit
MFSLLLIQLLSYVSFLVFVIGTIVAVIRYASMPMHLRWELYPVAHEKGRDYGGSYLEDRDWRTKPRTRSLVGELKYMGREGLLFQQCYKRNRGLWYLTYPFHMGVLLLGFSLFLLVIGAATLLNDVGVSASSNTWGRLIFYVTIWMGGSGLSLCLISCAGLLVKRVIDPDLRLYSVPADYLNLMFILVVVAAGFSAWYFYDQTFTAAREYVKSLIGFRPVKEMNTAFAAGVALFSFFLMYMPFSQMRHGLAKYFTYHRVRWEDEPNLRGSRLEEKIVRLLDNRMTWSATHIQQGQTWSEVVRNTSSEEEKANPT